MAAGVDPDHLYDDHASGRRDDRLGLAACLKALRADDPPLAIGGAKELIESTAKVVLHERGLPINEKADLPQLVKEAQEALQLHPSQTTPGPDGSDAVKRILGGAITMATGVAELRNRGYGTGHGQARARAGVRPRHAQLAVGAEPPSLGAS